MLSTKSEHLVSRFIWFYNQVLLKEHTDFTSFLADIMQEESTKSILAI